MADAEPSAPSKRRSSRVRGESGAGPKKSKLWFVVGGALLLAGVGAFLIRSKAIEIVQQIDWPKDRPGGEPVKVRHAVKAGDVFDTVVGMNTWLVLGQGV